MSNVVARPFLKRAGGKTSLLSTIFENTPQKFNNYYEPFVGGGAVFFGLQRDERFDFKKSTLNDLDNNLIQTYIAIRDSSEEVITNLNRHRRQHSKEHFLHVRKNLMNPPLGNAVFAAKMIYLNKTCFNGLWRVNKKGQFNVPFGAYENPNICDEDNLRAAHDVLQGTKITNLSFEKLLLGPGGPKKGDFVFCDPPYLPRDGHEFTAYHESGFGLKEHELLRDVMKELKSRGVDVMITNSGAEAIRELYKRKFEIIETPGRRSIGATEERRGYVPDVLIT